MPNVEATARLRRTRPPYELSPALPLTSTTFRKDSQPLLLMRNMRSRDWASKTALSEKALGAVAMVRLKPSTASSTPPKRYSVPGTRRHVSSSPRTALPMVEILVLLLVGILVLLLVRILVLLLLPPLSQLTPVVPTPMLQTLELPLLLLPAVAVGS